MGRNVKAQRLSNSEPEPGGGCFDLDSDCRQRRSPKGIRREARVSASGPTGGELQDQRAMSGQHTAAGEVLQLHPVQPKSRQFLIARLPLAPLDSKGQRFPLICVSCSTRHYWTAFDLTPSEALARGARKPATPKRNCPPAEHSANDASH